MRVRTSVFALRLSICLWALITALPTHAKTGLETETAELLVTLLKAGRAIVSERQDLINDPKKGHKGFTDEQMVRMLREADTTRSDARAA